MKVPHVQRVKRPNGRVDLYFRKGGYREGPLLAADGTVALNEEVEAILRRLKRAATAAARPKAGTVGGLLAGYNRSAEFLVLARTTQANYQDIIDELTEDVGGVLLSEVCRAWLVDLRDAWALRGHRAANMRMQVLKNAMAPVIDDDDDRRIAGDPFNKIKKVQRPHDAGESNPIWEDWEVEAGIEEALRRGKPGLARAIALGRWGGFRRGTICAIPRAARIIGFDDEGGQHQRLYWVTKKRKVLCDKREDPRLTALMASTPDRAWTLAYNADGFPWKERQLNQAIDRLMTGLAKQGKARAATDESGGVWSPLTIHGLRHSRGVEIAYSGGSDAEIMSQLEHATSHQAQIYRRQADRRRLADSAQDRIDNVVELRKAKVAKEGRNGA